MKLSTKGRYAVMAMVDLARHAQVKPVSLSDIATRQEISLSYLEQLFARLRRAGLRDGLTPTAYSMRARETRWALFDAYVVAAQAA